MKCIYCGEEISTDQSYYYFPRTGNGFPKELEDDFLVEEEDLGYKKFLTDNSLERLLGSRGAMRVVKSRRDLLSRSRGTPSFQVRFDEKRAVLDTSTVKGIAGFRVCPNCRIVIPDEILDDAKVLHIGLLASKWAGKTAFLYAMTANKFKNIRSNEFSFRLIQNSWLDPGHREFLAKLKDFEAGIIQESTEKGFCYPVAVEVRNMYTDERLIVVFYDVAGELLQGPDVIADSRLHYLSRLDVLFLLVDPGQIFENVESDASQSDIEDLLENLINTLKVRRTGIDNPLDTCLIVTKADKLDFLHPSLWKPCQRNPSGTSIGYDEPYHPDVEGVRKFRLKNCPELNTIIQTLEAHRDLFPTIRRYMVSALGADGFFSEERTTKIRDLSVQPLYLKGPLYETLLKNMEV